MTMTMMRLVVFCILSAVGHATNCERLKASLTYRQEEAPRDLSGLLPVIVGRINQVLEGVVDVEVEWHGGDLHGRVGEHLIRSKVTRLASAAGRRPPSDTDAMSVDEFGRPLITQCFHVPFTILDTNECALPAGHVMRHQCAGGSHCVNTIGSYECLCGDPPPTETVNKAFWDMLAQAQKKRSPWDLSYNSEALSSCPGQASTYGCCPARVPSSANGDACRAAFRCPQDPCDTSSKDKTTATTTCSSKATCQRSALPTDDPNYTCQCPAGLLGNGHRCTPQDPKPAPKVRYDGVTPTEETVANNFYCDCTKPVVDACSGFPPCKGKHEICTVAAGNKPQCSCKPGYVMHETYGCVDKSPPVLRLKQDPNNDATLRLKQGDVYHEYAVEIQDENAEEYLRSLKIAYSQPLPHGCFVHIGEFHVNYTVATPWTTPPYVRVTRGVVIEDIDECALDPKEFGKSCPPLIPHCHPDAKCINTRGSYTCQCPEYTSGDGFETDWRAYDAPEGYEGGTGCKDTHKPVIHLEGPNPKMLRVAECGGLSGILWDGRGSADEDLRQSQQGLYHDDIRAMVRQTAGAELCATHSNPKPSPSDCVSAVDETHKGPVNLSKKVKVGEPVQKSHLHWAVPYNVEDAAGNEAVTVWRDVLVDEVDLGELEHKFQQQAAKDRKHEIEAAVAKALKQSEEQHLQDIRIRVNQAVEEDRKRRGSDGNKNNKTCPACPACTSSTEKCECESHCVIDTDSMVVRTMLALEDYLPLTAIPYALFAAILAVGLIILRLVLSVVFANPTPYYSRTFMASEDRERAMQTSVTVYQPNMTSPGGVMQQPANGTVHHNHNGMPLPTAQASLFSPTTGASPASQFGSPSLQQIPVQQQQQQDYTDIYASPEVITPRRRAGNGVFGASPY